MSVRRAPRSRSVPRVAALITRRHEALREHVGPAHAGKVEGIHQARVASRRLREVVPVLGQGLETVDVRPLRKDLRELTRALGPVRELDVAAGMIGELPLQHDDAQRLRAIWLAQLATRRRGPERDLRRVLASRRWRALDRELGAFAAARAHSSDASWLDSLALQLFSRARDLRAHVARTGSLYRPGPLHEVRIATKKLRYVLEITSEAGLARLARPLRTLKAAQDLLGHLHDLDVLFMQLHDVPGVAPGDDLQHAAAEVIATIERQSRSLHKRYLRARRSLVRVADFTLDVVVPAVGIQMPGETPPDGD